MMRRILALGLAALLLLGACVLAEAPAAASNINVTMDWSIFSVIKATASAISQLIGMAPKTARIYKGEKTAEDGTKQAIIEEVPIATIERGDVVEVSAGDRIPVDGTVTWATSFMKEDGAYVDESMVTGEPSPALKQTGSDTLAGTMLCQGRLRLRAKKTGDDTTLAHIIKMVEEAQGSKAPVQRTVDRIARVFVPVVAAIALVTFIAWWMAGGTQALPQAISSEEETEALQAPHCEGPMYKHLRLFQTELYFPLPVSGPDRA